MKEKIDQFLACNKFAIAGVSRDKNKFGNAVFREMKKKDYDVVPMHPVMENFEGVKCIKTVSDLPHDVEALIIVTNPEASMQIIKDAIKKGIKHIFVQQGAHNDEIIEYASGYGVNIIFKQCIMMFARPSGIHKFHAQLAKLFRVYPN